MRSAFDRRLKADCTNDMAKWFCAILLPTLLSALFNIAQAKKSSSCDRKYFVNLIEFAPWTIRKEGRLTGISPEIIAEVSKRTGCVFIQSEFSFPKVVDNLKNGKSDIVMVVVQNSNIVGEHTFVPLFSNNREIIIAKDFYVSGKEVNQYIADPKIKFAHIIGSWSILGPELEKELLAANRLIGVPGPEEGYGLLKAKRVQALLFSRPVNSYYIHKLRLQDQFIRVQDPKETNVIGPLISIRRTSLSERTELKKVFEEIKADGTLRKILNKYTPEEDQKPVSLVSGKDIDEVCFFCSY